MQDASEQQLKPKSSAGYQPLLPAEFTQGLGHSAYSYVAIAAGLGLLVGVGVAITAGHLKTPGTAQVSAATSVPAPNPGMPLTSYAGPAPSLLRQVEGSKKVAAKPHLVLASGKTSKSSKAHRRHRIRKLLDWKVRRGAKRKPYVPENPPVPENQPTALQLATAAAAAGPFFLLIQGDATVANYDSATGTIETYEGEKYVLAKSGAEVSSIQWENFPFNVHYRCDETGNCTLSHAGTSAIARLAR